VHEFLYFWFKVSHFCRYFCPAINFNLHSHAHEGTF
jgi:hypothetical protein